MLLLQQFWTVQMGMFAFPAVPGTFASVGVDVPGGQTMGNACSVELMLLFTGDMSSVKSWLWRADGKSLFLGGSSFVLKGIPPLCCCSECVQVTHWSAVSSVKSKSLHMEENLWVCSDAAFKVTVGGRDHVHVMKHRNVIWRRRSKN